MKILVIGAGGIGCYYGAKLINSGHMVDFVARGAHLEAIKTNGLKVQHPDFQFDKPVNAFELAYLVKIEDHSYDLILLTAKATETQSIVNEIADWYQENPVPIMSLQNGVDNDDIIKKGLNTELVLGGIARRIGGHIKSPGIIDVTGIAEIIFGPYPNEMYNESVKEICISIQEKFTAAGIPSFYNENIRKALWKKLIINNGVNPLTALTGHDTKVVSHQEGLKEIVYGMMKEVQLVAEKEGIDLGEEDVLEMFNLIQSFDAIKTSMLVDVEKGRKIELEEISGHLLKKAAKHEMTLSFTSSIYGLLKEKLA